MFWSPYQRMQQKNYQNNFWDDRTSLQGMLSELAGVAELDRLDAEGILPWPAVSRIGRHHTS